MTLIVAWKIYGRDPEDGCIGIRVLADTLLSEAGGINLITSNFEKLRTIKPNVMVPSSSYDEEGTE